MSGNLPDLPEPADTAYVEGPAMQGGEYRTLSKSYEPDCAMYSPNQVRAIQEAAFNAGRAEGGKDAGWLPIETGPTNQQVLALYKGREIVIANQRAPNDSPSGWCHQNAIGTEPPNGGLTHWRPLPSLPTPPAAISQEPK